MQSGGIGTSCQRYGDEDQGERSTGEPEDFASLQSLAKTQSGKHNQENDPCDSDGLDDRDSHLGIGQRSRSAGRSPILRHPRATISIVRASEVILGGADAKVAEFDRPPTSP